MEFKYKKQNSDILRRKQSTQKMLEKFSYRIDKKWEKDRKCKQNELYKQSKY